MGILYETNSTVHIMFGTPGVPISTEDVDRNIEQLAVSPEDFFSGIDCETMQEKIKAARSCYHTSMTDSEIEDAVYSALTFDTPYVGYPELIKIPSSNTSTIFRARQISAEKYDSFLSSSVIQVGEFWEPPSDCAKLNRLNKEGESVFYCNFGDPYTTFAEAKASKGDCFLLMAYEIVEPIRTECIGIFQPEDACLLQKKSAKGYASYRIMHEFLHEEFSIEVSPCEQWRYHITNVIASTFFQSERCIAYPSIKGLPGLNLRINPDYAHTCLRLQLALLGHLDDQPVIDAFVFPEVLGKRPIKFLKTANAISIDELFEKNEVVFPDKDVFGNEVAFSAYVPLTDGLRKLLHSGIQ